VEIDHLVRAPDGIVVIETKTWMGLVSGAPHAGDWEQRASGQVRRFRNPLRQNAMHLQAVRNVLGGRPVPLRGLVTFAGTARLAPELGDCVVPAATLVTVLRESVGPLSPAADTDIGAAWRALREAASGSEARRPDHVASARARRHGAE
jgi:hypothetical protein